jgi:hypothetical protein
MFHIFYIFLPNVVVYLVSLYCAIRVITEIIASVNCQERDDDWMGSKR